MSTDLTSVELEELRKLTKGLLVRSSVDTTVMSDLAERGYVRQVLGGWKLKDEAWIALGARPRKQR